jgi:hypothetical protein
MSFRQQFADKIAEVRIQALDHFQKQGLVRPGTRETIAHLSGDNTRVIADIDLDPVSMERLQGRLDQIHSDLDMFEIRLEEYKELDPDDLRYLREKICRPDVSHLGTGDWGVTMGPAPEAASRPATVTDRIDAAAYAYVIPAADPRDSALLWEGAAAESFNTGFLLPFETVARRQLYAGVYLANVLQIFENMTTAVQKDLLAILDAVIDALNDNVENWNRGTHLSNGALFGSIVSLALPEPFDTMADAVDVVSIGMDIASRQIGDLEPPEWVVSWSLFTEEILAGGFSELNRLEEAIREDDQILGDAIGTDSANWDFRMVSGPPNPPDRLYEELVADIEDIYEVGRRTLPSAASLYEEAAFKVDRCDLPAWFNRPFTVSWSHYEAARMAYHGGLGQTGEHLLSAGATLVRICDAYDFQDTQNAAEFEAFKDALPPPEDLTPIRGRGGRGFTT